MIVKKCLIELNKKEDLGGYIRTIESSYEIYEKNEGNYYEVVAKNLGTKDEFVDSSTGNIVNTSYDEDTNFIVYPNIDCKTFITSKNPNDCDVSFKEELTEI